ncbi:YjbE family putative metal transport protein [Rhodoferax sp.]|uniref:YjbE family putative metal transport protein n=1 Tax=Rhodoferax sp. TaxID=50421 RepID=UPI0025FEFACA|nr:YjbE family putative metal transport protein [Rhodoferax sp.]
MNPESFFHYADLALKSAFVDLLLSGDNAVVIAMACQFLPAPQRRQALLFGTVCAIVLRLLLGTMAGLLLVVPYVKLVGGMALVGIAIKLLVVDEAVEESLDPRLKAAGFWPVIGVILLADLVMGIDNVVGLVAVSQGSMGVLAIGLMLSVPLLMYGSMFVMALLGRYPQWVLAGGVVMGWFAGDIAVGDPAVSGWVLAQAPLLADVVPLLTAAFVFAESRIISGRKQALAVLRPQKAVVIPVPRVAKVAQITISSPPAGLPKNRLHWTRRSLQMVGGVLAGAALLGLAYAELPLYTGSDELRRYDCNTPEGAVVYYRQGSGMLIMGSRLNSATGIVSNNQVDWGDSRASRTALGFVPPTALSDISPIAMTLNGGAFSATRCVAH